MSVASTDLSLAAVTKAIARHNRSASALRAICFVADNREFALPVKAVSKVTHCPPLQSTQLGRSGLVHIDSQVIEVLNLHDLLSEARQPNCIGQFLVIARDTSGHLSGIPADAPPDLLQLSPDSIRSLPQTGGASHITAQIAPNAAIFSDGEKTRTIFLLDLGRALTLSRAVQT